MLKKLKYFLFSADKSYTYILSDDTKPLLVNILEQVEDMEFIRVLFTSILGKTYSIELASERADEIFGPGICFDGSSVPGYAEVNSSDLLLRPLVAAPLPALWDKSTGIVPCAVYETSGEPHECDPINILQKVARACREKGFELVAGFELEFFLVRSDDGGIAPADVGNYFSTPPHDRGFEIRRDVMRSLEHMGIATTAHHHEVASGQHEIGLKHEKAEKAALSLMLAKHVINQIAWQKGYVATFMPKPFMGINGSGMHIHQSIWSSDMERNLFTSDEPSDISPIGKRYIAGILEYARALSAIVAPTVNSFKRLVPGYEAPTRVAWGPKNRTTMVRVPHFNGSGSSARIEFRCPDPSCSPHLALAAILSAGMHGIEKNMTPPEPVTSDLFHGEADVQSLPGSLAEALDMLENAHQLGLRLGSKPVRRFLELKRKEWERYHSQENHVDISGVTDWEIKEYLYSS